jgi:hypothetical protein
VAKNYYFENFENSMEQSLIEDLVIESIKIYGIDAWYIPRTLTSKDDILNEDDLSTFSDAYMAEMYIKSVDGFEGEGDFLSKFGLEIRDSITMTIARRTYESEIGGYEANTRPLEGDLIYLPLNNKIFEIQHVEHESIFYQMGSLQMYDLRAELFEYSGERFSTGQKFIDDRFKDVNIFQSIGDAVSTRYIYDVADNGYELQIRQSTASAFLPPYQIELEKGVDYVFDGSALSPSTELGIYESGTTTLAKGFIGKQPFPNETANARFTPEESKTYDYKILNGTGRANQLFYTENIQTGINASVWVGSGVINEASIVGPGPGSASLIRCFSTSGSLSQVVSLGSGARHFAFSAYFRNLNLDLVDVNNVNKVMLTIRDASTDALVSTVAVPSGSDWQRVLATGSLPANVTSIKVELEFLSAPLSTQVEIWGPMLESRSTTPITEAGDYQPIGADLNPVGTRFEGSTIKISESKDTLSDNESIEAFGDNLLDFTNSNPFGEDSF